MEFKKSHQREQRKEAHRSFLVDWDEDNDPMDPRNCPVARKWSYVLIICVGTTMVTFTSSIYTLTYDQIMREFDCSLEVATLGLSLFVLGLAVGPLLFSPFSEFYGRRPVYITSTICFLIWLIPCAVAQNIQTLLVARFFNGLSGSAFLCVAGGTIVDMFHSQHVSLPMTIFTGSPFVGPALGPLVGGFINSFAEWRWTFYVTIIWAGCVAVSVFLVPETFHPVLLRRKADRLRKIKNDKGYHSASEITRRDSRLASALLTSLYVPFKLLFLDPMIAVISLYSSLLQGILYLFFGAFPLIFRNDYGFNLWQIGLTFLGLAVGNVIACFLMPLWNRKWIGDVQMKREESGEDYKPEPELRLPPAIMGAPMITVALFWFAWTSKPSVHWIVPILATVLFSVGYYFAFQGLWTFLMAAYPKYAASALAVNTTTRCVFGAAFPLFTTQMYETLGYPWASTLLAFLTLAMMPFPFLFYKFGGSLRTRSKFASA